VVASVDLSLNTELAVLTALSGAARRRGRVHRVILMVDLGDLREGIWPDQLLPTVAEAIKLPGIAVVGIGANLACFEGVVPSRDNMNQLMALVREVERAFHIELEWVSGVNSSGLDLIASGQMPPGVNHARLGESILLGRETVHRRPWPGTFQDSFILHAEILELKNKPSLPIGQRSQDAFGQLPVTEDHGMRCRALLNVGREDVDLAGVTPTDPRLRILGASSGYLVVDVGETEGALRVGDEVCFFLNYSALLAAMTSEYVKKRPLTGAGPIKRRS
jgi:predicted amino acid racemase